MWNVTLEFVWTTGFPSFLSRRCVCTWSKLWLSTSYFCRTLLRLRYENATPNFCWVSCAINKRGVWDYIWIDTHLPRFEALFSSLWRTHIVISVSSVPNGRRGSAFWLGRKTQKFSGTNQKPERPRQFGTGLVRHCPQGLFSPFFSFLRAIFSRPFRFSLAPTGKNL